MSDYISISVILDDVLAAVDSHVARHVFGVYLVIMPARQS